MPTVSIKLAIETKHRLDTVAAAQGLKPHALMVLAIETTLAQAEQQQSFVASALRSRQSCIESGLVIDGPAFGNYLKARVRGQQVKRPAAQSIDSLLPTAA
jgi:predicted transcriptional regulator